MIIPPCQKISAEKCDYHMLSHNRYDLWKETFVYTIFRFIYPLRSKGSIRTILRPLRSIPSYAYDFDSWSWIGTVLILKIVCSNERFWTKKYDCKILRPCHTISQFGKFKWSYDFVFGNIPLVLVRFLLRWFYYVINLVKMWSA